MFRVLNALVLLAFVFVSYSASAAKTVRKYQPVKSKSGIQFLKFEQVAKLPWAQRVQYVKLMRRSLVDFEKFQTDFQPNPLYKGSSLEPVPGERELYAAFFGQFAHAEQGRGEFCADKCIYTGHIRSYRKVNGQCVRYPFGCQNPGKDNECDYGGKTKGWQCNTSITGLRGKNGCVSKGSKGTVTCFQKADSLSVSNNKIINANLDKIGSYFGISRDGSRSAGVSTKGLLPDSEAQRTKVADLIKTLADMSYDDEAYAMLLTVVDLYKQAGVDPPVDYIKPASKAFEYRDIIETMPSSFNSLQTAVDDIFADYRALCRKPLKSSVLREIKDDQRFAGLAPTLKAREKRRRILLSDVEGQGITPTHGNVLQQPQCAAVDKRYQRLKSRVEAIANTYPRLRDDVLPGEPPIPDGPSEKDSEVVSMGCPTPATQETSNLYLEAARCTYCAAQKAVHNSDRPVDFGGDDEFGGTRENSEYVPSTKWMALLSTMALACGRGSADQKSLDPRVMQEFIETYGHCDSEVYDWHTSTESFFSDTSTRRDRQLVQKWTTQNFWKKGMVRKEGKTKNPFPWFTDDKDTPGPDIPTKRAKYGEFSRIYGISYEQATGIFCDPNNFAGKKDKSGYMTKINRLKYDDPDAFNDLDVRKAAGRARMKAAMDNLGVVGGSKKSSAADDLLQCIRRSTDLADEVYSAEKGNMTCMRYRIGEQALSDVGAQMTAEDGKYPGNFVFNDGSCGVSQQIEKTVTTYSKGKKEWVYSFVDPKDSTSTRNLNGRRVTVRNSLLPVSAYVEHQGKTALYNFYAETRSNDPDDPDLVKSMRIATVGRCDPPPDDWREQYNNRKANQ